MAFTLSFSAVQTYQACPKRYYFRYKEKHPSRPHASMSFGSSIHNTLYHFLAPLLSAHTPQVSLLDEAIDLSLKRLLSLFDVYWIESGYENRKSMYERKVQGIKMLTTWYEIYTPHFGTPMILESSFKFPIEQCVITGRYDRIDLLEDGSLHIIDYKTGKLRTQESVNQDMQLGMYLIAAEKQFGKPVSQLSLYFFEHDLWLHTVRTNTQKEEILSTLNTISAQIMEEEYTPTPSCETCKRCDYISLCAEKIVE